MRKIKNKILSILMIILTLVSVFQSFVNAVAISSADVKPGENLRITSSVLV